MCARDRRLELFFRADSPPSPYDIYLKLLAGDEEMGEYS